MRIFIRGLSITVFLSNLKKVNEIMLSRQTPALSFRREKKRIKIRSSPTPVSPRDERMDQAPAKKDLYFHFFFHSIFLGGYQYYTLVIRWKTASDPLGKREEGVSGEHSIFFSSTVIHISAFIDTRQMFHSEEYWNRLLISFYKVWMLALHIK